MSEPRNLSPQPLSPQAEMILEYLTHPGTDGKLGRTITPLVAHATYGIASLTARIAELRKAGYAIKDRWDTDHFNRRYKSYWIEAAPSKEPTK